VVLGLWDSWDDDAFVRDKRSGQFFQPSKMHALNHTGPHFSVRGPLNLPRPPQGHPVIVQAGGSEDMIEVAAKFAEVIFCAPLTLESGKAFYATMKSRVAQHGRSPDHVLLMPGLSVLVCGYPIRGKRAVRVSTIAYSPNCRTRDTFNRTQRS
jgi:alkanesulfonate monooxygenase